MDDKNAPRPLYTHGQKVVRPPSLEQAISDQLGVIKKWVTVMGVLAAIVLIIMAIVALVIAYNWVMGVAAMG